MPRPKTLFPRYRFHAARKCAVVTIDGKDHYLGPFDSPLSRERYHRLLAEFQLSARTGQRFESLSASGESGFLGINVVVERYFDFARVYYSKNGKPGQEYQDVVYSLEPLTELFGLSNAGAFGPKSLKLIQEHMIGKDWSRRLINARINRIRRMFKWAVAEELVPSSVLHGLQAVPGLRYGRTNARETEPVKPVDDWVIKATLPFLMPPVAAMVRLQRLTGMRPCEVTMMRGCDIERTRKTWTYEPSDHKNRWRGHQRLIPLGPKAQKILKTFLKRPSDQFLFSPIEAEKHRSSLRRQNRKTPMTPSQAARKPKKNPKRAKRDRYDRDSYRRAIDYAVQQANKKRKDGEPEVPKWYPLQIRHTRATEVRRRYGLDGAQSALGHKNADVTQVYAERNLELAVRIAQETG